MWELGRGLLRWTIHHKKVGIHVRGTLNPTNSGYFLQHYNLLHWQWWRLSSKCSQTPPRIWNGAADSSIVTHKEFLSLQKVYLSDSEMRQSNHDRQTCGCISVNSINRDLWSSLEQQFCQLRCLHSPTDVCSPNPRQQCDWSCIIQIGHFGGGKKNRNYATAASFEKSVRKRLHSSHLHRVDKITNR